MLPKTGKCIPCHITVPHYLFGVSCNYETPSQSVHVVLQQTPISFLNFATNVFPSAFVRKSAMFPSDDTYSNFVLPFFTFSIISWCMTSRWLLLSFSTLSFEICKHIWLSAWIDILSWSNEAGSKIFSAKMLPLQQKIQGFIPLPVISEPQCPVCCFSNLPRPVLKRTTPWLIFGLVSLVPNRNQQNPQMRHYRLGFNRSRNPVCLGDSENMLCSCSMTSQ